MTDATIARATRRQVEREGTTINIITKTEGTESEHGETVDTETTTDVAAIVSPPSGQRDPDAYGVADVDLTAEITVADTVSGITDGAGKLATEIDVDQDGTAEYRVAVKTDQQNGLLRLECVDATDDG